MGIVRSIVRSLLTILPWVAVQLFYVIGLLIFAVVSQIFARINEFFAVVVFHTPSQIYLGKLMRMLNYYILFQAMQFIII